MASKEYQRLTWGRSRHLSLVVRRISSLWLGSDHLLCVDSTGYNEEYKRFYFRDIQAFTICQTDGHRIRAGVYGFFLLLCGVLYLIFQNTAALIVASILGLPFAILFLVNLALGPMARCWIRTAVQEEELPSLCRVRRAQKILARLRPLIHEAQGQLNREKLSSALAELAAAPPRIGGTAAPNQSIPSKPYRGRLHHIFYLILFIDLPITLTELIFEPGWTDGVSLVWMATAIGFAIAALVQQRDTLLPRTVKNLPWIFLISTTLMIVGMIAFSIYAVVNNPDFFDQELSASTNPTVAVLTFFSTSLSVGLGATGLILLRRYRLANALAATEPPVINQPLI